ncbi:FUSC family protein [Caballeronia sp. dw_276]|uniref:FUSC family protein n=1 Tax=Caballeronia sp. dw_276 TaxID=2719795 RepID=UPI001BD2D3F2|nr:FUSC family protein [Caballeronia sp. dw_276]
MNQLLLFLRDELTPFPGRLNVALRCIASAVVVIVASMTLQVPYLAVSLIVVFYVTQSNVVITRMIGMLFLAGTTLAIGCTVLLLKWTFDYPLLRIVFASIIFFCCVYAMRVFQFGVVFFIAALVVIYAQSFVDVTSNAEGIVRATLWVWVAVCYPIALTLVVNSLVLPLEPRQQLRRMMVSQLVTVRKRLSALHEGASEVFSAGMFDVQASVTSLQKLLRFTAMRGKQNPLAEARDLATVTAVSNLYLAASNLHPISDRAGQIAMDAKSLGDGCATLADSIEKDVPFSLSPAACETSVADMPWPLVAIRGSLRELDAFAVAQADAMHVPPNQPVLAADAFSNPVYVQFSLKTLLAVLVCYVFYNAAGWQGVHTVMLTCLIVAQPSLGASGRRSILRFWGAVVGSLLALLVVVFVLPRIDGIAALLIVVAPILFAGAWIAAGSERISYAGAQLMFTFSLAFLDQFAPTYDLTGIRDRMVGIFLGVAVATFVQMNIWPEGEAALLRRKLSASLAATAKLLAMGQSTQNQTVIGKQRMAAWAALSDCEGMLLRVALEPTWREGEEERVTLFANSVFVAARELLLAADSLRIAFDATETRLSAHVEEHIRIFASGAVSAIEAYSTGLSTLQPSARTPDLVGREVTLDGLAGHDARLIGQINRVLLAVSSLPEWLAKDTSLPLTLPADTRHE